MMVLCEIHNIIAILSYKLRTIVPPTNNHPPKGRPSKSLNIEVVLKIINNIIDKRRQKILK